MTYEEAKKIVHRNPDLYSQMGNCFNFLEIDDILSLPDIEFKKFYTDFVEMAVEINPSLLEN